MTPLQLRTALAKKSGRYDLVDPSDYSDNGMDFHVEAGLQYLDGMVVDGPVTASNYPHIVMMAALRSIDMFTSNLQGARNWATAIAEEIAVIGGKEADSYAYENDTDYCE